MQLALPHPGLPHDTFSAALKLSHVSRRFRLVAHSASELWTAVCPKFPLGRDQAQFWTDALERSGERLIDIVINAEAGFRGAIQPYKAFLGAVVCRSNRWRKFEITSNPWEPTKLFLDKSRRLVLPGLEELTLHHSEDLGRGANQEDEDMTPIFHNTVFGEDVVAPMLKIIKLGATYLDYSRMQSLAKNLIELHIENHTYPRTSYAPEMIIDMLRASPELRVLTFTNLNIEFDNRLRPVELQYLHRLEFRGFSHSAVHLFPLLRLPSLEALRLGERRPATNLETVTMTPVPAADSSIMRVLTSLFTSATDNPRCWRAGGLREFSLEYSHYPCVREVKKVLRLTRNVETFRMTSPVIFSTLADPEILPNLWHWVVKSPIFCAPHPFSDILADRPGVTLFVEGDLTQDGERLHNALKDAHRIVLRP